MNLLAIICKVNVTRITINVFTPPKQRATTIRCLSLAKLFEEDTLLNEPYDRA